VPELSRFLGIVITMYFRDHPPAHFHARYGEHRVRVFIESGEVEGFFPRRALAHVREWLDLHRAELAEAWNLVAEGKVAPSIEPLE
jgi:hypothetical protein